MAVPVPGLGVLSYRVPDALTSPPKGARVEVPVGGRSLIGCVVDPVATAPAGTTLRDLNAVIDATPFLPSDVVDLALWVGEYYACGPGDALTVAMPPASRRGSDSAFRTITVAELVRGTAAAAPRGAKQREALALLTEHPGGLALTTLAERGVSGATMRTLQAAGLVTFRQDVSERDPFDSGTDGRSHWMLESNTPSDRPLTEEQHEAFATLQAALARQQFQPVLLHGVTGSGKTELYLRMTADVITQRGRVLVLVPEIALTPALAGQFRARFGTRIAIQHSGLSDGERHDQWHRIRRGEIDVVVGTRSAVFAPLDQLRLIIVDEEHEASYKQEETPRYHGRDVAVVRGRMAGAMVLLGTATPSLESAANAESGRYQLVRLTRRVLDRPLARVRVVDMRREMAEAGTAVAFSSALLEGLTARLDKGEQSLVLLNRRGFATVVFCRGCGASIECPHCSVTLTFHRTARRLRCHYCNYAAAVPKHCGECGGEFLEQSGFGTERLEADLRAAFPSARIARVDRDTMRRRGAMARILAQVAAGELDIVVGTQMIAKGHDFPSVTLVGVVSADVGLGLADFRAGERTFQLLTQVVGRAGRGSTAGEAIVQTLYPEHYSVTTAAAQDYAQFYAREMEFRRAMHYPPALSLVNVVVKGRSLDMAMSDAQDLARRVRQNGIGGVIGPAPAAVAKIKDEYRAQFFIKGTRRAAMRAALLAAVDARPDLKRRVVIDIDPVSVT